MVQNRSWSASITVNGGGILSERRIETLRGTKPMAQNGDATVDQVTSNHHDNWALLRILYHYSQDRVPNAPRPAERYGCCQPVVPVPVSAPVPAPKPKPKPVPDSGLR